MEGIQVYSSKGPRPSPRGDNGEIVKLYWKYLKIFFFRTIGPISTKLGTKHFWVNGIQVYSNEGPRPFPRGDNCQNVKLYWKYLKTFFSRTTGQITTRLCTMHPWVQRLKLAQWFWRRRWKCEKFTYSRIDGRQAIGKAHLSLRLRWAYKSKSLL